MKNNNSRGLAGFSMPGRMALLLSWLALAAAQSFAAVDLTVAPVERQFSATVKGNSAAFDITASGQTPPVMRALEITGPAENVTLHVAGGPDFSSIEALSQSLVRPGMTDEEKVKAIFYFAVTHLYDRGSQGCDDPLEYVSLYGHSFCGNYGLLLNALWRAAGFETVFLNPVIGMPSGHTITAVKYDGSWHMYDSRLRGYFLNRDNHTIASLVELDRDDFLLRRGLDYGFRMNNHWDFFTILTNYHNAESDWYDGQNAHFDNRSLFHETCPVWDGTLDLRQGERVVLGWDQRGEWWNRKDLSPRWQQLHRNEGREATTVPPLIYANGSLTFDIDPSLLASQALERSGVRAASGAFIPEKDGSSGSVVYRVRAPYFIPRMQVRALASLAGPGDRVAVELSADSGATWIKLGEASGAGEHKLDFTSDETQRSTMYSTDKYSYRVRFTLNAGGKAAGCVLRDVRLTSGLFYRPEILPALRSGLNRITWRDTQRGGPARRMTLRWLEDSNITFSEDSPCEDDSVTITAKVSNRGDETARNVRVRFWNGEPEKGGKLIGENVIPEIASGNSSQTSLGWRAEKYHPGASHGISLASGAVVPGYTHNTIYVQADPESELSESDESNNTTSRELIVYNKANLVLVDPSFLTFSRQGETVRLTALVRNQNLYGWLTRAREAREVVVRFYDGQPTAGRLDRRLIGEAVIPSIAPGEFGAAVVDWNVSGLSGHHRVYAVVDPFDRIAEVWQTARGKYMQVKKDIDLSE